MSIERPIKLYDFPSSPNCQRVKVVLEEKKLPYETIHVDLRKKEQKKPEFLNLNPNGKVPVIIDGATVLYESRIINEYLEDQYPEPPLMPKTPVRRAKIRLLIDYALTDLIPPHRRLREQIVKDEKERDPAVIESVKGELIDMLRRFEYELGDQPYLAGDFSLLDAAVVPRFLRLEEWNVLPHPSLPRLGKWLQRTKDRPAVQILLQFPPRAGLRKP
jgi:glutathione S-transferase